jgi:hypothetical protein
MDSTGFNTSVEDRYFEDYVPGSVHEFGRIIIDVKLSLPLANNSTLSFSTLTLTAQINYTVASLHPVAYRKPDIA